jgi:hypothetical protein
MRSIREDNARQVAYRWAALLWRHGMGEDEVRSALEVWARGNAPAHWLQSDYNGRTVLKNIVAAVTADAIRNSQRVLDENSEIGPPWATGEERWIQRDLDERCERFGREQGEV